MVDNQSVFELRGYRSGWDELNISLEPGEIHVIELPGPARRRLVRDLILGKPDTGSFSLLTAEGRREFPGTERPGGALGLWRTPTPWPRLTPAEAVRLAARGAGRRRTMGALSLLDELELNGDGRLVHELTGTEETRLALALGLAGEPSLLVADNPQCDESSGLLEFLSDILVETSCLYLHSGDGS